MKYIPIILSIGLVVLLLRVFRGKIVQWLFQLRAKLKLQSLRQAIADADKDKAETKRKNMVVFNTTTGTFEPVQKKLLKKIANGKKQEAVPNGFRQKRATKSKYITKSKVREVEKKSLYITN
mgnify:CR=1 FL=1